MKELLTYKTVFVANGSNLLIVGDLFVNHYTTRKLAGPSFQITSAYQMAGRGQFFKSFA